MNSQTRALPPLSLRAAFQPSTLNEERRTVELTWTTGARVLRGFWERYWEELSLDPKHVHLERLNNGAPFLADHDNYRVGATLGVIERAWLADGVGRALVRFAKAEDDAEADKIFRKIADGVICNCSVGYRVEKLEKVEEAADKIPVYRATSWTPHEVSAVAIGADDGAGFRSSDTSPNNVEVFTRGHVPHEEHGTMSENQKAVQDERERAATIALVVRKAGLDPALADKLIADGTAVDAVRALVLDKLAERSDNDGTSQAPSGAAERGHGYGAVNEDDRVRDMAAALASRAGCREKAPEGAQQYVRLSMVDLARLCLERRGISPRLMSAGQIVTRAYHSTSDFKALLGEAGNRVLLDGYNSYPGGVKQISRQSTARDFRAKSFLRLGEAPELLKVGEHGEVKSGTMASSASGYSIATFARIFGLTRQAIINDDLSAFDMVRLYGRAAAELEATEIVKLLTGNPVMPDGVTLFHADHGNLASVGAPISVTSLGAALAAMRTQKGLDKKTPINVVPRFLVVPAALEVVALQHVQEINATQASDANPFSGQLRLSVVVDPRLDMVSSAAWYVAADPNTSPTVEHSYLDGAVGPEVIEQEGFDVEGTQWKARMDFGCGVISHEGLYKNSGA